MNLRSIILDTLTSVQFLSRLPVHLVVEDSSVPDFSRAALAFPLAGMIIAIPSIVVLLIGGAFDLNSTVLAMLTIATLVIVTGALHEDGLADTADGFFGGHSVEKKLAIMRDSQIGTYGTLALIISIGLRAAMLAAVLTELGTTEAILIVLAVSGMSRLAMLQPWCTLPPTRASSPDDSDENIGKEKSGLSHRYGAPTLDRMPTALLLTLPALLLLVVGAGIIPTIITIGFAELIILGFIRLCRHHIGGQTGDTLGATQQLSELGLYLGILIAI